MKAKYEEEDGKTRFLITTVKYGMYVMLSLILILVLTIFLAVFW
jgi:hypothetical protein